MRGSWPQACCSGLPAALIPDFRRDQSFEASRLSCASPVVGASRTGKSLLSTIASVAIRPKADWLCPIVSFVGPDSKQTYVPCGLEPLASAIWGQSLASRPRGADEVLYN